MGRPITIVEHDTGRVYGEGYVFSDGRVAVELDGAIITRGSIEETARDVAAHPRGLSLVDDHRTDTASNLQAFVLELEYPAPVDQPTRERVFMALYGLIASNLEYDKGVLVGSSERVEVTSVALLCGDKMIGGGE